MKEFLEQTDTQAEDDDENVIMTTKFLTKWDKLNTIQGNHKKIYDSKATKDRKIKYTVHEKIQNFMEPLGDEKCLWSRFDILKTLFGTKPNVERVVKDKNMGVKLI